MILLFWPTAVKLSKSKKKKKGTSNIKDAYQKSELAGHAGYLENKNDSYFQELSFKICYHLACYFGTERSGWTVLIYSENTVKTSD